MKIIVTGGAGFIGSHLVDALVAMDHNVVVIDNFLPDAGGKRENVNPKAKLLEYDIRKFSKRFIEAFRGIDYVFHCAALPRVQMSIIRPYKTYQINVAGTINVLWAAVWARVKKVIYSSSSSVYGNQERLPLSEDMIPNPISPYGFQKLEGEQYCRYFYEPYKLATVCLRYFNVYGSRQSDDSPYSMVIGLFLRNCKAGLPCVIDGDGKQTRDFTHVSDVVLANILAAESDSVYSGEVINIGAGKNYSIKQIAEIIGGIYGYGPVRPGDPRDTLADISKAKKLLGWEPQISLKQGIAELKKNYGIV